MATMLQENEQTGMGSSDAVVSLAVQNAAPEAGEPSQPRRTSRQTVVAAARSDAQDAHPWVVHGFAAFYMLAVTIAWLGLNDKMTNPEYFAQCALVLTSIGLYHATPPGKKKG